MTRKSQDAAPVSTEGDGWRPISEAPHNERLLLGWYERTGEWNCVVGRASWKIADSTAYDSRATHFRPLPAPPKGGES